MPAKFDVTFMCERCAKEYVKHVNSAPPTAMLYPLPPQWSNIAFTGTGAPLNGCLCDDCTPLFLEFINSGVGAGIEKDKPNG